MISGRWDVETRNIGKRQGYLGLSIFDSKQNCTVNGPDTPAMNTCWFPTPAELERLNAGQPVVVTLLGVSHPPISVGVLEPDRQPAPPLETAPTPGG